MRVAAVLVLAAALGRADADADADISALVEELGAPSYERRHRAYARLAAYGERIIPVLRQLSSNDPEVTRLIRGLTRAARTLKLHVAAPAQPPALGGPLVLDVRLVNDTDDTHVLPLTRRLDGGGTFSAFFLEVEGKGKGFLRPDQVEWPGGEGPAPILGPGDVLSVRLTLTGEASPLRRPGSVNLRVGYDAAVQRRPGLARRPRGPVDSLRLQLTSEFVKVEGLGRKPAELEAALRSKEAKTRVFAVAELTLREDDAILPVLRRHARDPDLKLAAVRRLGAKAEPGDFDLVYLATRDEDAKVRAAAVAALGNYRTRKARATLIGLAQDHELKVEAIKALRNHRSALTIDLFVRLLRQRTADRASIELMCNAIFRWTRMPLTNRGSEISAFEKWWLENRARWARENEVRFGAPRAQR